MTEAYFIEHCNDSNCDLGAFEYTCPICNKVSDDYEVWWEWDNMYGGKVVQFKCNKCGKPLEVKYNKKNYCYEVNHVEL